MDRSDNCRRERVSVVLLRRGEGYHELFQKREAATDDGERRSKSIWVLLPSINPDAADARIKEPQYDRKISIVSSFAARRPVESGKIGEQDDNRTTCRELQKESFVKRGALVSNVRSPGDGRNSQVAHQLGVLEEPGPVDGREPTNKFLKDV